MGAALPNYWFHVIGDIFLFDWTCRPIEAIDYYIAKKRRQGFHYIKLPLAYKVAFWEELMETLEFRASPPSFPVWQGAVVSQQGVTLL